MRYALVIGNNSYPGTGSDLAGCHNDACDWHAVLSDRRYQVQRHLDVTGDDIRILVQHIITKARSGDRVVITYSGHGSYVPDQNADEVDGVDECWVGSDVASTDRAFVTDDELAQTLKRRASGIRVVVISDSCHSGTMTRLYAPVKTSGAVRQVRFLPPAPYLRPAVARMVVVGRSLEKAVSAKYPAVLLSGCQDNQYSYDAWFGNRPNGAFTRVAIDSLRGATTYREWMAAIRRRLPTRDYPQTPRLDASLWQKYWGVF